MAQITLDINKTIEQNAGLIYDRAKKIKRKIEGAERALEETKKKLSSMLEKKEKEELIKKSMPIADAKREWYEKFHWFTSSEGFLVIGGKDATSNEILIKKHAEKGDIVFHTDMIGSPFFVIKTENKMPGEAALREAADATASFSKAWKLGMASTSVFYCSPEQLTKEAPSGEYIKKGGFVTKGKLNYIENRINLAVGTAKDGRIMSGPVSAIKANCIKYIEVEQGKEKTSKTAKQIQHKIGGSIDDIVRALPPGCRVKK